MDDGHFSYITKINLINNTHTHTHNVFFCGKISPLGDPKKRGGYNLY
jgi:hypothetical protein